VPKPSRVSSSPVTPETSGRRTSRQRVLTSSKIGGPNKPLELLSGDKEDDGDELDVFVTDEEETLLSRAAGSSTLSVSAERHDSSHSRDIDSREKDDIETETRQRPKRAK